LGIADLGKYLPPETTEIVSGGAKGVDTSARDYAEANGIKLTEFLPEYGTYGRLAPLKRNISIIEYADVVLAFWNGDSRGTKFVIDNCEKMSVPVKVFIPDFEFFSHQQYIKRELAKAKGEAYGTDVEWLSEDEFWTNLGL